MSDAKRPRPETGLVIDPENAYARLGVSPLVDTEAIRELLREKRKAAMEARRGRGTDSFGDEEAEMTRLQEIEAEIGTPRARARYDALHPQNALLTVQPLAEDRRIDERFALGIATAWLREQLGPEGFLPSPLTQSLWALDETDEELVSLLRRHATRTEKDSR
jgi:hypothetical protein